MTTHQDKVIGVGGLGVGLNGTDVADPAGDLYIRGVKITAAVAEINQLKDSGVVKADLEKLHAITKTAEQVNGVANGATANSEQAAVPDLDDTLAIDGADTVNSATVLAAIQALEAKTNAILTALRAAGIVATGGD